MVIATSARARIVLQSPTPAVGTSRQPSAMWLLVGLPVLLLAAFVWQIGSSTLRTELGGHEAVSVGRVSLEADPNGTRVDFVLVDRVGQQATVDGTLNIKVREPDGALWRTTRQVSADDFQRLPDGELLAGRMGYSVLIPTSDWARTPRRGGLATVSIAVEPTGTGPSFSTVDQQRLP